MKELGLGFVQGRLGGDHWNYSLYSLLRSGMVGPQAHQLSFEERLEHLEGQLGQQRWRQLGFMVSFVPISVSPVINDDPGCSQSSSRGTAERRRKTRCLSVNPEFRHPFCSIGGP